MKDGENLLMQIWWNDQDWEKPCKDRSLPVCNTSKEGSCVPPELWCSDSTIFSEYARYLKKESDFKRVGKDKYVFFISRKNSDDAFYLVGYFIVARKEKNFLNKTLTKISGKEQIFDFAILGHRDLSKRLSSPIRLDRKLIEKLELPLKYPKDGRKGGIEFDRRNRRRMQLNDLECISQAARQYRELTDNDVLVLLETIADNKAPPIGPNKTLPTFPDPKTVTPRYIKNKIIPHTSQKGGKSKGKKRVKIEGKSDEYKKAIGKHGELIVYEGEKRRLTKAKRPDLAKKVKRISLKDDSKGYDILSFRKDGSEKYIEVKSTKVPFRGKNTNFEISANEVNVSKTYGNNYYIYRVFDVASTSPKIKIVKNPYGRITLEPKVYNAIICFE